jgi:hypothetical protein
MFKELDLREAGGTYFSDGAWGWAGAQFEAASLI